MPLQPHSFRFWVFVLVILCALPTGMAMAKNIGRDGSSPDFWESHRLVLGKISGVERSGSNYLLRLKTTRCTPAQFPLGNVIEVKYEATPNEEINANAGDLMDGLKRGDTVLVLLRTAYGGPTLPSCIGEYFTFMPDGVSLYRVESADDQNVSDTTNIVSACSIPELSKRIVAISSLMEDEPSDELKLFFSFYVDTLVGQTESDLANARTLLKNVKDK